MNYQPMPDLSASEYEALRANIKARGILVPIVVDQDGRIIDGNNRATIAAELGIECPREVRHVRDHEEALDLAVELNCSRRHLTQEQKRQLIASEIQRRPGDSDRAIARRIGCSPTTVGSVRNPTPGSVQSGQPMDDAERALLRELTGQIDAALKVIRDSFADVCVLALSLGCSPWEVLGALTAARMRVEAASTAEGPGFFIPFDVGVFRPLTDYLTDDDAMTLVTRNASTAAPEVRREVLAAIHQFGK